MSNYDKAIDEVASLAHEDWRALWRAKNGDAPRLKPLDVGGQVDIAALTQAELPWQYARDNAEMAKQACDIILHTGGTLDLDDYASIVHNQWIERKRRSGYPATPEQAVPFAELSADEQEKDRVIVRRVKAALERFGFVSSEPAEE